MLSARTAEISMPDERCWDMLECRIKFAHRVQTYNEHVGKVHEQRRSTFLVILYRRRRRLT